MNKVDFWKMIFDGILFNQNCPSRCKLDFRPSRYYVIEITVGQHFV